jgi:hypothetical protein
VATNPQCLQVETNSEIHLFPYGYFQHAKFSRQENKEVIEIRFQNVAIIAGGKNLKALCDSLARLSVQRIKAIPNKYHLLGNKNEINIDTIEIKQITPKTID